MILSAAHPTATDYALWLDAVMTAAPVTPGTLQLPRPASALSGTSTLALESIERWFPAWAKAHPGARPVSAAVFGANVAAGCRGRWDAANIDRVLHRELWRVVLDGRMSVNRAASVGRALLAQGWWATSRWMLGTGILWYPLYQAGLVQPGTPAPPHRLDPLRPFFPIALWEAYHKVSDFEGCAWVSLLPVRDRVCYRLRVNHNEFGTLLESIWLPALRGELLIDGGVGSMGLEVDATPLDLIRWRGELPIIMDGSPRRILTMGIRKIDHTSSRV